ncbi:hypothetical protein [Phaeobacter porticola]|uniref:Uncharacterized protein n=1 Tax=Phaeobacter porticola TaxID=1844006 RepID=A0A1L3I5E0_9RHOB|nr:hypothetical protein [Phaeobacter porticola]APG47317.1 hypothetical protein PhaeoP97_01909 [Phaeobacter porticola]
MTQVDQYKGKLGFEARHPDALSIGSTAVVDTLEEYGHVVRQFQARSPNLIQLDCDHYRIELRYRRHPIKPTQASEMGSGAIETRLRSSLGVSLVPIYPDHCDAELSELLLAVILQRLVEDLEVATVDWLDAPMTLTRAAFLGAFHDAAEQPPAVVARSGPNASELPQGHLAETDELSELQLTPPMAEPAAPIAAMSPAPIQTTASAPQPARLRGRACFEPVEETAAQLEQHCQAMLETSQTRAAGRHAVEARNRARARATAVLGQKNRRSLRPADLVERLTHVPLWVLSATTHALRSPQLRGPLHILCGATALLALQSSAAIAF